MTIYPLFVQIRRIHGDIEHLFEQLTVYFIFAIAYRANDIHECPPIISPVMCCTVNMDKPLILIILYLHSSPCIIEVACLL